MRTLRHRNPKSLSVFTNSVHRAFALRTARDFIVADARCNRFSLVCGGRGSPTPAGACRARRRGRWPPRREKCLLKRSRRRSEKSGFQRRYRNRRAGRDAYLLHVLRSVRRINDGIRHRERTPIRAAEQGHDFHHQSCRSQRGLRPRREKKPKTSLFKTIFGCTTQATQFLSRVEKTLRKVNV